MEWINIKDRLPADNQECWITNNQAFVLHIVGPIVYKEKANGWLDLFASSEAGTLYSHSDITHWADGSAITEPPE